MKAVVRAHRMLAWGMVGAIVLASLLPSSQVPRSRAGGHAEHVAAHAAAQLSMASAYPAIPVAAVAMRLAVLAATLEYLQRFAPGRRSSLLDVGFSAVGILLGCLLFVTGRVGLRLGRSAWTAECPRNAVPDIKVEPGPPTDRFPPERSVEPTMDNRQRGPDAQHVER